MTTTDHNQDDLAAGTLGRLRRGLSEPVDGASLAFVRVAFALITSVSCVRFVALGWVDRFYGRPDYFFPYAGFEWVRPLSVPAMTAIYLALAIVAAAIAFRRTSRMASGLFFLGFTYVELIDVTNYLNHYYLVSLLALLLAWIPTGAVVPRWGVWLARLQIGVVYTFAACAKMTVDWTVHGQPMNIWMTARAETFLIGPLLAHWWVAWAMGWAGLLNDLLAPWLLSWKRTRLAMYGVILVFHAATSVFFNIGIFPIVMTAMATIFFAPDWPRRWSRQWRSPLARTIDRVRSTRRFPVSAPLFAALIVFATFQLTLPARWLAYGGNVNWHEQGMRWSWKVMCREKNGSITYTLELPDGRRVLAFPSDYLTDHQEREFSGQPDMIVRLGQHIGDEQGATAVFVEALVSLNGRAPALMIDPDVDLLEVELGWRRADWILPAPTVDPPRIGR